MIAIDILMTIICIISIIGLLYIFHKAIEVAILKYAKWVAHSYYNLHHLNDNEGDKLKYDGDR